MGRLLHPLLAMLASLSRQELARQVTYLQEENRILRARLPKRLVVTEPEKRRLIRAGRRLGPQLKELISIVSYQTFARWIRKAEGTAPRNAGGRRKPGRPRTPEEVRDVVIRIRQETGYGYTKILGELRKLGLRLSRQSVKNILVEAGIPPGPHENPDSWDAFLKRHAETLWQCDFLSKRMWTPTGFVELYLLVFLHLGSRRCWISPCTAAPDSAWVSQQARNFQMHAEDVGIPAAIVLRDNDAKFSKQFDAVLESGGTAIKRCVPMSPNLRAHVERFIQTLKVECLDHFVIVGQRHLNHVCREFAAWYNHERPHTARGHLPPGLESVVESHATIRPSEVVCGTRLGGLLKSYSRRAA